MLETAAFMRLFFCLLDASLLTGDA